MGSTVTGWDLVIAGAYLAISLIIGVAIAGKQRNLASFLLAGRQIPRGIVAVSILAALFSGISFLGAPAETFHHNLIYLWALVAFFIATPVTATVFLPLFFRLNLFSVYEYLEHRFDLRLRQISSASFIFRVCFWLALALYAPSLVISEMLRIPVWPALLLTGLCSTIYTTVGGMKSVIYTDVIQFCVLLGGIILILFVATREIPGGLGAAWHLASVGGRTRFFDWSLSPTVRMTVWNAFFGGIAFNFSSLVTDQISVQRCLTARSLREGQRALWIKLALMLPVVGLFYLTGLVLYGFYQTHPAMAATLVSPDRLLPNFASHCLATPIPGLLIAAILSATLSAVSSGINALTTTTLVDFLYVRGAEGVDDRTKIRAARGLTVVFGGVVIGLAFFVSRLGTFIEATVKIGGFFGGPLLGAFFLGAFSRRANGMGTLLGMAAGFAAVAWIGCFTDISFMWYALTGTVVTYGTGLVASGFFARPSEGQVRLTFRG